jgi:hypothetical protein
VPLKPNEAAEQLLPIPIGFLETGSRAGYAYHTRVHADELVRILRRCRAPEPWQSPSAVTGIGTIAIRINPHPAASGVQAAIDQLKRAIDEFETAHSQYWKNANKNAKLHSENQTVVNEFPTQVTERVNRWSKSIIKLPDILYEPPSLTMWHLSALILFEHFKLIVGTGSPSANGPAVQFVQLLLARLGLRNRSCEAIEKALRRLAGAWDPFLPVRILGFRNVTAENLLEPGSAGL